MDTPNERSGKGRCGEVEVPGGGAPVTRSRVTAASMETEPIGLQWKPCLAGGTGSTGVPTLTCAPAKCCRPRLVRSAIVSVRYPLGRRAPDLRTGSTGLSSISTGRCGTFSGRCRSNSYARMPYSRSAPFARSTVPAFSRSVVAPAARSGRSLRTIPTSWQLSGVGLPTHQRTAWSRLFAPESPSLAREAPSPGAQRWHAD